MADLTDMMRALQSRQPSEALQALQGEPPTPRSLPPGFTANTTPDGVTHYFYRGEPVDEKIVKAMMVGEPTSTDSVATPPPNTKMPASYGIPQPELTGEVRRYIAEQRANWSQFPGEEEEGQHIRPKMLGVFESGTGSQTREKMRQVWRNAYEKYGHSGNKNFDAEMDDLKELEP